MFPPKDDAEERKEGLSAEQSAARVIKSLTRPERRALLEWFDEPGLLTKKLTMRSQRIVLMLEAVRLVVVFGTVKNARWSLTLYEHAIQAHLVTTAAT